MPICNDHRLGVHVLVRKANGTVVCTDNKALRTANMHTCRLLLKSAESERLLLSSECSKTNSRIKQHISVSRSKCAVCLD